MSATRTAQPPDLMRAETRDRPRYVDLPNITVQAVGSGPIGGDPESTIAMPKTREREATAWKVTVIFYFLISFSFCTLLESEREREATDRIM